MGPGQEEHGLEDNDERVTDILFGAVQAASSAQERRSTTFLVPGVTGGPAVRDTIHLDVVAGSPEPGSAVVTIQRSRLNRAR